MSLTTRRLISLFDPTASLAQADILLSEASGEEPVVGIITKLLSAVFEDVETNWHQETQRCRFKLSGSEDRLAICPMDFDLQLHG